MKNPAVFDTDSPTPPISSLVDIAFLLLIFFIVSSTLLKKEQDLDLSLAPRGDPVQSQEIPVQVNVDDLGIVLVGSGRHLEQVEPAGTGLLTGGLHERLAFAVAGAAPDELPVILDISNEASQQRVIAVLDTLAGLGIRQINLLER